MNTLYVLYHDSQMRLFIGCLAVFILIINFIFMRAISVYKQREKTIAFDNPSGRVSISLTALEDLIRRVILKILEIKEVRSSITASKKGLTIHSRIVLSSDVNIPEITSRVQELVKRKIQDTIGLEEAITVRVHIVKIITEEGKNKRHKGKEETEQTYEPRIPFRGGY